MEARVSKGSDGRERVLIELAEFQALVDARCSEAGLPDIPRLVKKLGVLLDEPRDYVDLDGFLADYDAAHGESS